LETQPTVGFTLGYEDAPIKYIDGYIIEPREQISDKNCIKLDVGKNLTFDLNIYAYASEGELGQTRLLNVSSILSIIL
jgi:hypothetical protein